MQLFYNIKEEYMFGFGKKSNIERQKLSTTEEKAKDLLNKIKELSISFLTKVYEYTLVADIPELLTENKNINSVYIEFEAYIYSYYRIYNFLIQYNIDKQMRSFIMTSLHNYINEKIPHKSDNFDYRLSEYISIIDPPEKNNELYVQYLKETYKMFFKFLIRAGKKDSRNDFFDIALAEKLPEFVDKEFIDGLINLEGLNIEKTIFNEGFKYLLGFTKVLII
jgi:hypothetical protein